MGANLSRVAKPQSQNCRTGHRFNRSRAGAGRCPSSVTTLQHQTWTPASAGETHAFFRLPLIPCLRNGALRDSRHRHPSQNCRTGAGRCPSSLSTLQHQTWAPTGACPRMLESGVGETPAFFRLPLITCSLNGASRDSRHRHPSQNCRTGVGRCPSSLSSLQHQTWTPASAGETPVFFRLPLMKCSRSGALRDSRHRHPSQNCRTGAGRCPSSVSSLQHQTWAPTSVGETPVFLGCHNQTWTPASTEGSPFRDAGETPVFCRLPLEAWMPACAGMTACNLWMSL